VADEEQAALNGAQHRLQARFPTLPPETVAEAVKMAHARFAGRPVRDFVPLLVEREAADHLRRQIG
jgi:hypothetical protein